MKSDSYQRDELAEHSIARASPNSQSEKVKLLSFNNNSFFKCELSVQNFIIKYCWKMYMFIFGYTAIWSYMRRAELQWHIHYEASSVIPLLEISNVTQVRITVLYLKPFKIRLRIELFGVKLGWIQGKLPNFSLLPPEVTTPVKPKASESEQVSDNPVKQCLHWNLKLNEMHMFDDKFCRDPAVAYG